MAEVHIWSKTAKFRSPVRAPQANVTESTFSHIMALCFVQNYRKQPLTGLIDRQWVSFSGFCVNICLMSLVGFIQENVNLLET